MQEDLNRYYLCKPGIISNMADHEEFSNLFREFEKQHAGIAQREPKVGDSVQGRIISIQKDCAFIDLGAKTEGIVGIDELTDADGNLTVAVGDTIEITVSGRDAASGTLLLGNQQARHTRGEEELRRAFEQGASVEGRVSGVIKGGLEVEISGERAFCPASQIDIQYVDDLERFVGEKLPFRITKFEGGRRVNLVVSRRALLEAERNAQAEKTRERLEVGAVMKGRVTTIKDFGAFVDLGGVEGMVHISELSFGRIDHPKELLTVGQQWRYPYSASKKPTIPGNRRESHCRSVLWKETHGGMWLNVIQSAARYPAEWYASRHSASSLNLRLVSMAWCISANWAVSGASTTRRSCSASTTRW